MNVAPICSGSSRPISRSFDATTGLDQAAANVVWDTGPAACRLPTSMRSNGVAFHREQSMKTSQNARTMVLTSVPGLGRATGTQYVAIPPSCSLSYIS